ncbi:Killer protein [bacteria symbiont BFo1 of Frankliniella occidentalis]|jgi:proteic killer suppression protein|uniref:Type II toxin-antitoxin system RelE/ParE family toxin n=1 Tax=Erwinia aphidicola TaxID=68334 RepID=A0ABU8DHG7_ERWAP|nr:type II toxin-antitoxin system RelE/ParE family toxin [Erwinia aphidicola]KMV68583.1 Killer protein [bacteria symbiont BFo1 of Frankliniella occidentalis]KYP83355.1 Killer protein [bacteria symbiont BFo1 of Frankliniella occidentalis]KYP88162.1 Killer protein [bacteria symbiont BFo1 of Frankliniella occidentalis]CAH0155627.1 Endoribonuclease HigB [Erwinia aphidicola]
MITSFKHKGLENFFMKADRSGIEQKWVPRIKTRLTVIDAAETIDAINLPGYDLHQLKGDRADIGSISVSGNWRITFRFIDGDAEILNLEDYH